MCGGLEWQNVWTSMHERSMYIQPSQSLPIKKKKKTISIVIPVRTLPWIPLRSDSRSLEWCGNGVFFSMSTHIPWTTTNDSKYIFFSSEYSQPPSQKVFFSLFCWPKKTYKEQQIIWKQSIQLLLEKECLNERKRHTYIYIYIKICIHMYAQTRNNTTLFHHPYHKALSTQWV